MKESAKILKPAAYSVTEDGPVVKLQVGNSVLPMTWDVAIRIGQKLRVHVRDAQEYIGLARTINKAEPNEGSKPRKAIREHDVLIEGRYKVFAEGPDTILQVGDNARLTMTPEVALNISGWLCTSAEKVRAEFFSDMHMRSHVAVLTDGTAKEREKQSRRDATATFG